MVPHVYNFFCLFVFKTNNISYALLFFLVSIASLTCLITCGTEDDHETKMFCYSCAAGSTEVSLTKLSPLQKTLHFLNFKHARWEMNVIMIRFLPYFTLPSVQFSSVVSDSLRPHELQHARPPCPSPTPRVYSNSRPWSW